jgi:hypothetical protein
MNKDRKFKNLPAWELIEDASIQNYLRGGDRFHETLRLLNREEIPDLCGALIVMRDALEEVACGIDAYDAMEVAREALDACDVTSDD